MTLKLSCADFTFPLLGHADSLRLISMIGCGGADLGIFEGRSHVTPGDIAADPAGSVRRVKEALDAAGLAPADVFFQPGESLEVRAANHPDPGEREQGNESFRRVLDFAAALGAKHMTGLPGMPFEGVEEEDGMKLAAEVCADRVRLAAEAGIVFSVEPHTGSIAPTPGKALELVGQSDGLTLTVDYGHFIAAGHSNDSIHPLVTHAGHFHARGGTKGQLQSTMKENTIDFPAVLAEMKRTGYAGWICLEYVWIDWEGCNRADNVSESCLLRDLLRASA